MSKPSRRIRRAAKKYISEGISAVSSTKCKNESDDIQNAKTQGQIKEELPKFNLPTTGIAWTFIAWFVTLALGAPFNYFGASPWILMIPAFAVFVWLFYLIHKVVSFYGKPRLYIWNVIGIAMLARTWVFVNSETKKQTMQTHRNEHVYGTISNVPSRFDKVDVGISNVANKVDVISISTKGRDITPEQRKQLNNLMGLNPKIGNVLVTCDELDKEAWFFSKRINEVLIASNFKSRFNTHLWFERPEAGLHITVKDQLNIPECANLIANAFNEVGLTMNRGKGHIRIISQAHKTKNIATNDLEKARAYLNVDIWNWSETGSKNDASSDDAVIFVGETPTQSSNIYPSR